MKFAFSQLLRTAPVAALLTISMLNAGGTPALPADSCGPEPQPGATLLVPYFEIDLDNPDGRTTLISVSNADPEPVVARATLWTNMAIPTLVFDMVIQGDAVVSLNLRSLLEGDLPQTAGDASFSQCIEPIAEDLLPDDVAYLQAQHLGVPPFEGSGCYGLPAGDGGLAVGYLTIDAMNDCTDGFVHPGDNGVPLDPPYFAPGGTGLASNRNVLWGDVFYIDSSDDSAMGIAALALQADADRFAQGGPTFYSGVYGLGHDQREPMPSTYRSRFFNGGAFAGGSDLILWLDPQISVLLPFESFDCEEPDPLIDFCQFLNFRVYTEDGELVSNETRRAEGPISRRIRVGSDELPVPVEFGFIEVQHEILGACILIPTGLFPAQASAVTVLRAGGRFSAALDSVALDSLCAAP